MTWRHVGSSPAQCLSCDARRAARPGGPRGPRRRVAHRSPHAHDADRQGTPRPPTSPPAHPPAQLNEGALPSFPQADAKTCGICVRPSSDHSSPPSPPSRSAAFYSMAFPRLTKAQIDVAVEIINFSLNYILQGVRHPAISPPPELADPLASGCGEHLRGPLRRHQLHRHLHHLRAGVHASLLAPRVPHIRAAVATPSAWTRS